MALLVILVVFAIQRLLHWVHIEELPSWIEAYFDKMSKALGKYKFFHGAVYTKLFILLFPIPLLLGVLSLWLAFTNIFLIFGLNTVIFWYCLGDSRFKKRDEVDKIDNLFISAYTDVFAVIFWFVVLRGVGVTLYYLNKIWLVYCHRKQSNSTSLIQASLRIQGALNWIPVRLLGLSFAFVGHFFIVASGWLHHLKGGLFLNQGLAAEYGKKAMFIQGHTPSEKKESALFLIERALWFWLIVLSLTTILLWLG